MKKKYLMPFFYITVILIINFCLNYLGISEKIVEIISTVTIGFVSFWIIWLIRTICYSQSEFIMLLGGYFIRLFLLVFDCYGRKWGTILSSGADSESFWKNALLQYNSIPTPPKTKYPYVLKIFMQFFGENRFLVQYMNIVFWFLTILIFYKIMEQLKIKSTARFVGIFCLSFFPQYIILSSILLRESIMIFFNTYSLYYFILYFIEGKNTKLIISGILLIPSLLLHSGVIGIVFAYMTILSIYDCKKEKIKINIKSVFIIIGSVACFFAIYTTSLKSIFLEYLPSVDSIFELLNKYYAPGKSDYLVEMKLENYCQIVPYTIIRIFYFLLSPVPWEWRGWKDAFAFFGDSALYAMAIYGGVFTLLVQTKKKRIVLGVLWCFLLGAAVYSWGVSNAGTAMRHRCKFVTIAILLICLMLNKYQDEKM